MNDFTRLPRGVMGTRSSRQPQSHKPHTRHNSCSLPFKGRVRVGMRSTRPNLRRENAKKTENLIRQTTLWHCPSSKENVARNKVFEPHPHPGPPLEGEGTRC